MPWQWVAGAGLVVLGVLLWAWGYARTQRRVLRGLACPNCGEQHWVRVHRRMGDRLFGLGVRRYRCLNCRYEALRKRYG